MTALYRWPFTVLLVVVWLPFAVVGLIGEGGRWMADRIVDLIDRINE